MIFILFGYLAIANPNKALQPHACVINTYDAVTVDGNIDSESDEPAIYLCNSPANKNPRIRTRFRAASFFKIDPVNIVGSSDITLSPIPVSLSIRRATHIIPFYYVFLFRLTPF